MEKHLFSDRNWRFVYSVAVLLFILAFSEIRAQDYHKLYGGGQSVIYQTGNAKILIRASSISTEPLFKVEGRNGLGNSLGTVQTLVSFGDKPYGIYQTAPTIFDASSFGNYFESRVNIGQSTFPDMLGVLGDFGLRPSANQDTIHFNVYNVGGCSPTIAYRFHDLQNTGTPLTINNCTVKAPIFETVSLKIAKNPGENLVLISDPEGNASWADPSRLHDDDWLPRSASGDAGELMNLCMNDKKYTAVGIGTESPKSRLHVVDGNIMISRSALSAPGSANGSLLFGEVINPQSPSGEWGIEYFHEGLNFKKVPTTGDPGKNNCLFLKNNGNVGIATELPLDRFQVNDGIGKVIIGAGPVLYAPVDEGAIGGKSRSLKNSDNPSETGLGYLGFNVVHNDLGWLTTGDGNYNGYSMIYNSLGGDMFFSSAHSSGGTNRQLSQEEIETNTKLTIHQSGNIGIGTLSPDVALDIRRYYNASIQCFTENPYTASIWVRNNLNGYGLVTDNQGTGHISLFGTTPTPIMSFESGKVTVVGDLGVSANLSVSGKVGIGAVTPGNYPNNTSKLYVEGGITTEEVHVNLKTDWSDFVFTTDYKLRSLSDLEQYIVTNKHLPEVPTSAEVEKDGIELGKMNALLLQKVEELTLYILQLEKRMAELESKQTK